MARFTGRIERIEAQSLKLERERVDLEFGKLSDDELREIASGDLTESAFAAQYPQLITSVEVLCDADAAFTVFDRQLIADTCEAIDSGLCRDSELDALARQPAGRELFERIAQRVIARRETAPGANTITDDNGKRWIEHRGPTGAVIALPDNGRDAQPGQAKQ